MTLRAPGARPVRVRAVRPNAGVRARYEKQLLALVDELNASIMWWVTAAWRKNPPPMAQDASTARDLDRAMRKMAKTWNRRFKEGAKRIAAGFADGAMRASDVAFKAALRDAGFSVRFQMTRGMNEAYQAVLHENVSLIRSISSEHLADVEQAVHRSISQGRDLKSLQEELQERFGVARSRAQLIARDQNNKATSAMNRGRQRELGISRAYWRHTAASKEPRPEHLDADGEEFDLDKGLLIDGEYIFPGEEINCGCIAESIVDGYNDEGDRL